MVYFLLLLFFWFVIHRGITGIGEQNPKLANAIIAVSPILAIGSGALWFYQLSNHTGRNVPLPLFFLAVIFVFQAARKRF